MKNRVLSVAFSVLVISLVSCSKEKIPPNLAAEKKVISETKSGNASTATSQSTGSAHSGCHNGSGSGAGSYMGH